MGWQMAHGVLNLPLLEIGLGPTSCGSPLSAKLNHLAMLDSGLRVTPGCIFPSPFYNRFISQDRSSSLEPLWLPGPMQ